MAYIKEQSKEYSKLSINMGHILTNLTTIQHDNPQQQQQTRQGTKDKEGTLPQYHDQRKQPRAISKFPEGL